ncbi:sodium/hydrogen exchanger 9B2-like [Bacillus rossius redtenbacheri]|uniref:sodium/hydrogen exchanger 9B2-like n=1 Tax=Bacillus rossius redtenbacheri TaxID=93214 RepID=UPI002FDDD985
MVSTNNKGATTMVSDMRGTFPEWLEESACSVDTLAWSGNEPNWRGHERHPSRQSSSEPAPPHHHMLDPALACNPMLEPLDLLPGDHERKASSAQAPEGSVVSGGRSPSQATARGCPSAWLAATSHPRCPSWMDAARAVSFAVIGLVLWGVMYSLGGTTATPGGQLFNLYVLYVTAVLAGYVAHGARLPPLVGMLLMGALLRNTGFLSVSGSYLKLVTFLRRTALMTILTRAALEFDPKNLERFRCVLLRLALLPSLLEAATVALLARYVLGLPWLWGVFLGITLASAAPAVTIPSLFGLQLDDYGTDKDIPALIIAASSLDDLVSLAAFGVPLSVILSEEGMWASILRGPIRVIVGLTVGITWGLLLKYVPEMYDDYVHILRALLLGLGGTVMLLTSGEYGFEGAGPVACMMGAFIACHSWRRQGFSENHNPVANCFAILWGLMQPVLFSLIGGEIDLSNIDGKMILLGAAVIYGGLLVRMLITVWVSSGVKFNWKEKAFIAMSWFPKGTVQAALGPTALDLSRLLEQDAAMVATSTSFLHVVILAILLTAPLGSLLPLAGRQLLSRAPHAHAQSDTESVVTVGAFSELASGVVNRGFIVDPAREWHGDRTASL